ncbi:MAG: DegT/DnrJ/EryC1/StrS family aminotransferase [Pedobacter sp.]|nr:MAG: DegT/DnrJ/EryC1/StrS family aminotransferase [Pedobacter sp.]
MNIPFAPPFIDQSVIDEVVDTLNSKWITTGPKVLALQNHVKEITSCRAALCVNSWTSGAILMLKWYGIQAGDEVIIPAYSYCATALCVLHCGATPVMVDINDDFNISISAIADAITNKTKAIIAVDIAGWPSDYIQLMKLIKSPSIIAKFSPTSGNQFKLGRILLIADAAHSLGAKIDNAPAAVKSDVAIFSFHAVKNITTAEGGCICLNLPQLFDIEKEYAHLKMYTLNGQNKDALAKSNGHGWKYDILFQGMKINMPDICAAIGIAQIKKYNTELLPERKIIARTYQRAFLPHPWFIPAPLFNGRRESSYHLYPLRIKNITEAQRDQIIDQITQKGIAVNVHFIPMPMLTLFKNLGFNIRNFPMAYKQYACEISLPIYPGLTEAEIAFIISTVIESVEAVRTKQLPFVNIERTALFVQKQTQP